jgi:hypothetical protein
VFSLNSLDERNVLPITDETEEVEHIIFAGFPSDESVVVNKYASGIICQMASNSLTTSDMEGRKSVSSRQHLSAREMNFWMHSIEYESMRLSTISSVLPNWHFKVTYNPKIVTSLGINLKVSSGKYEIHL